MSSLKSKLTPCPVMTLFFFFFNPALPESWGSLVSLRSFGLGLVFEVQMPSLKDTQGVCVYGGGEEGEGGGGRRREGEREPKVGRSFPQNKA